jgi:hypothetical protein
MNLFCTGFVGKDKEMKTSAVHNLKNESLSTKKYCDPLIVSDNASLFRLKKGTKYE